MNPLDARYRNCLCFVVWFLAACGGGPAAPPAEPAFEIGPVAGTDRHSYSWRSDSALTWILANPHGVDVFHYPGHHVFLERYDRGHWELIELYGSIEADPVRLALGDTLSGSIRLTNDAFPESGWYRVHSRVYRDTALTILWPLGNRVSPAVWVGP